MAEGLISRRGGGSIYQFVPGLAGKFFNGGWRSRIATGNIGSLPLTTENDSSNVTGTNGLPSSDHRYGVNIWPYINYNSLGNSYGFIAIGYFTPPTTGDYTFFTASDDGSGVWVGNLAQVAGHNVRSSSNATVNNDMGSGHGTQERSSTISLTAGVRYPIRIVHEEGDGGDDMVFSFSGPSITKNQNLLNYFTTPVMKKSGRIVGNFVWDDNWDEFTT